MKSCMYCRQEKSTIRRRFGLDARGQVQLDAYLCEPCGEQLSHFGPYAKVLTRKQMNVRFVHQPATPLVSPV